jgi:hypothetical protein
MISLLRKAAPILLCAAASLASCSPAPPAQPTAAASNSVNARAADSAAVARECIAAGAEALETLTEHAAATPAANLEAEARSTSTRVMACANALPTRQASELTQIIQRVDEFQTDHDRTRLALSAVEGYRVLVSAQIRGARDIPLEVALLDYAGFRYQASVRSATPLWSEARQAIDFADEQWSTLAARISDDGLKASFGAELNAMRRAVEATNVAEAQRASSTELDRVDELEQYFAQHAGN